MTKSSLPNSEVLVMAKKTPEQISYNMSRVKNKDSAIEVALRKELWSRGLRYRKNVKTVFGKPDIVFVGKKVAVFCDSEFWHGYNWEVKQDEIERNMKRDKEVNAALEAEGWKVLRFWGDEIKKDVKACADLIVAALKERDR